MPDATIAQLRAQLAAQAEAMQELDAKATEAYEARDAALHDLQDVLSGLRAELANLDNTADLICLGYSRDAGRAVLHHVTKLRAALDEHVSTI